MHSGPAARSRKKRQSFGGLLNFYDASRRMSSQSTLGV
jgi:hypothetical protein